MDIEQETKRELKPKLRFPEFRDAGEWEEKKLGDLGEFKNGINFSVDKKGSGTLTVDVLNMYGSRIETKLDSLYRVDVDAKDYLLQDGDILFVRSSMKREGIGWSSLFRGFSEPVLFCGFLIRLRLKSFQSTNPTFLLYYLRSDFGRNKIISVSGTAAITNISQDSLKIIPAPLPILPEQQKIADCLSSIDDRITAETQKLDTLKVHKKGLMQQLFPAEGETLPKLRFLQFRDAREWEKKRIEDLAIRGSGHTPNKSQPSYYNGGIKWISLADSNKLDKGYIYETKIEISMEGLKNSSAVLHPPGTVVISRDAGVGKSAVLYSPMAVSQHFIAWRCDKSKLSNWFLYFFLQALKPKFEEIATGSTIKTIGLPYFKEICIPIPSVHEQQKIADCLSSIDDLITAQTQKIDTLKVHKKGLMQQLFPSANGKE